MKERNKQTTETTRTCQVTTVKGLTCHKPNIQNFALLLFSLSCFVMMNWWGVCLLWSTMSFKKKPLTIVDVFVRRKSNKIPNRWCNMYSVFFFFFPMTSTLNIFVFCIYRVSVCFWVRLPPTKWNLKIRSCNVLKVTFLERWKIK